MHAFCVKRHDAHYRTYRVSISLTETGGRGPCRVAFTRRERIVHRGSELGKGKSVDWQGVKIGGSLLEKTRERRKEMRTGKWRKVTRKRKLGKEKRVQEGKNT